MAEDGKWPVFSMDFEKHYGGFWKTGILSGKEILYFEGRHVAKFKSCGH